MYTFTVKLLRASELEVGETFLETFANVHILEFFLNQVACILYQIKGYLKSSGIDQLVQNGHGLLKHVQLLNLLFRSGGDELSSLQSIDFEH